VLIGARSPADLVFSDEFDAWSEAGAHVETTVDVGDASWHGHVGVVTTLIADAGFDPEAATAMICGPEVMMRFCARALIDQGVDPDRILVSAERNMQCGVGLCGHCQLGPLLLCRDGPVLRYSGIVPVLMGERER
jgi:NAD(P)H-flavin reductase